MQWKGEKVFPPAPTLALSASKGTPGQTVSVGDAATHTTYWWVSTLQALESLLGGSATAPTVSVTFGKGKSAVPVVSNAVVAPATYVNSVFTPPTFVGHLYGANCAEANQQDHGQPGPVRLRVHAGSDEVGPLQDQGLTSIPSLDMDPGLSSSSGPGPKSLPEGPGGASHAQQPSRQVRGPNGPSRNHQPEPVALPALDLGRLIFRLASLSSDGEPHVEHRGPGHQAQLAHR